jgi:uncharacterized membrane protein YhaH (DUF805 family)
MSNPYGWAPPTAHGQQAVYFARPGESIAVSAPGTGYGAPEQPYDNGYAQYASFASQHPADTYVHDPFAKAASSPWSLRARGERPSVSIAEATTLWVKNWRNLSGRASVSEYWGVQIVILLMYCTWWVLAFAVAQMADLSPSDPFSTVLLAILGITALLVPILAFIPNMSLTVRRFHDTDHSGWNFLLLSVPFVSGIARYYLIRRSDPAGWRFDDTTQPLYGLDDI